MDYIQILVIVVHNYIVEECTILWPVWLWWHRCLHFYALFLAILKPYFSEWDLHTESTKCKWMCDMNIEPFIVNLGHPLWGSQSFQEIASGMRNFLPLLVRDATCNSCIDWKYKKVYLKIYQLKNKYKY